MTIRIAGHRFSVDSHEIPWGAGRTRTVLHVAVQPGINRISDDDLAQSMTDHQDELDINCVPGNKPSSSWPVIVVTPRGKQRLDVLALQLHALLEDMPIGPV